MDSNQTVIQNYCRAESRRVKNYLFVSNACVLLHIYFLVKNVQSANSRAQIVLFLL